MGHNGEAAPRVCVPANAVSAFIGLLVATLIHPRLTAKIAHNAHSLLTNNFLKSSSDLARPSSVKTTDLDLPTGS